MNEEIVNMELFFFDICLAKAIQDIELFYSISEEDRYILKDLVLSNDRNGAENKLKEITNFINLRLFLTTGMLFSLFISYNDDLFKRFPFKN